MKASDYVSLGFIAIFVTIIAYFLVNSIMGDPKEASVKFEYITGVSSQLDTPNEEIFNAGAVNPTVEVYVGDCLDQDQDGILSDKEKRDCGLTTATDTGVTESDYLEENGGLSNDENNKINDENGYARGTSAEQREAVEKDIEEKEKETTEKTTTPDEAAKRETVSGS